MYVSKFRILGRTLAQIGTALHFVGFLLIPYNVFESDNKILSCFLEVMFISIMHFISISAGFTKNNFYENQSTYINILENWRCIKAAIKVTK